MGKWKTMLSFHAYKQYFRNPKKERKKEQIYFSVNNLIRDNKKNSAPEMHPVRNTK